MGTGALDKTRQDPAVDNAHRLMVMIFHLNSGTGETGLEREPLGSDQLVEPGRRYRVFFDRLRLVAATARVHADNRRWPVPGRRTSTHKV